uniref:ARAD1D48532p n=1 Tax=Blastobotrys adeninivorans TaxID=409370 RepID=A0A060TJP4_BLAAD
MTTDPKSVRGARRKVLKELNRSVWDGAKDVFPLAEVLDTSLKRNTAFIKRCKVGLNEDQQSTLLKEIASLSLERYISEIVADFSEGLVKCKSSAELFVGVEVASALHQRFGPSISCAILSAMLRSIQSTNPDVFAGLTDEARAREINARSDRNRIVMRVIIELWLVDVFRYSTDPGVYKYEVPAWALQKTSSGTVLSPPMATLKHILHFDTEGFATSGIAISVVKAYGSLLLGLTKDEKAQEDANGDKIPSSPSTKGSLVSPEEQQRFMALYTAYTRAFQDRIVEVAKKLRRMERGNEQAYIRTGKVLADRKERYESLMRHAEGLWDACKTLSDLLSIEMPQVRFTNETEEEMLIRKGGTVFKDSDGGIWDDDEQKNFYENVTDIRKLLEAQLAEEENKEAVPEEEPDLNDDYDDVESVKSDDEDNRLAQEIENLKPENDQAPPESSPAIGQPSAASNNGPRPASAPGTGASGPRKATPKVNDDSDDEIDDDEFIQAPVEPDRLHYMLMDLSENPNREVVDKVALEFMKIETPGYRKRVIEFFARVRNSDSYKLSFFARFVATLHPLLPDITEGLIGYLNRSFNFLQRRRKNPALFQRQMFNIKFLCELIKFDLVPKFVIFNRFTQLTKTLDDFNALTLVNYLEGCGRYLLRKTATNVLMTKMLRTVETQTSVRRLSYDKKTLLVGAVAYVRPRETTRLSLTVKKRPIIEKYIRHLVYSALEKNTASHVLAQLLKMDWNDTETLTALQKVFTKIHKVNFSNVKHMAWMLVEISKYYPSFVTYVIDGVFESIRRGLEISTFAYNQKRLAEVRYISELFCCGLIEEYNVYETLYLFLSFGHPKGKPIPGVLSSIDPPNDFFRIRLICSLLEVPDTAKKLHVNKDKLDLFLANFEFYLFTKDKLSMEVEFQLRDTFDLIRPQTGIASNIEEAVRRLYRQIDLTNGGTGQEDESKVQQALMSFQASMGMQNGHGEDESEKEEEMDEQKKAELERRRKAQEEYERRKKNIKAAVEIERDLQNMMLDRGLMLRESGRKMQFQEPVPSTNGGSSGTLPPVSVQGGRMRYSLMTKQGTKTNMRAMGIPTETKIAQRVSENIEQRQKENDRIKEYILRYSEQYDSDEDKGSIPRINQPELTSYRYRPKK